MTTKTKRSKDAARTSAPGSKKASPAPESAAGARLRKEARAAVAANLAELERADPGSAAAHSEQGGEPREPQKPQPDQQQQQEQTREPATPAPAPGSTPATPKPGMSAKKGSAKSSAAKPKVAKPAAAPKPKRLSCIDAAAMVIGKDPIGCKDLIAEMGQRKLWSSPGGKTPDASLYAAIIREISAKKSEARFKKVDRGLFVANLARSA